LCYDEVASLRIEDSSIREVLLAIVLIVVTITVLADGIRLRVIEILLIEGTNAVCSLLRIVG
jgi:hypothetical protein